VAGLHAEPLGLKRWMSNLMDRRRRLGGLWNTPSPFSIKMDSN